MPPTTKRLDLRFGSFACSVQGFDDPVMPVQQILRAIQHLLEETPELSDAGISFDAEAVESLIEEVARRADLAAEDIEITPGLVIVHRGENDATARERYRAGVGAGAGTDPEDGNREDWERASDPGEESAAEAVKPGSAKPAYVNIFATRSPETNAGVRAANVEDVADEGADLDSVTPGDGEASDPVLQDRLRDIFAETVGDPDSRLFSERPGADGDEGEPLNLPARSDAGRTGGHRDEGGGNIFGAFELRGSPEPGEKVGRAGASAGLESVDEESAETGSTGINERYTVAGLVQAAGATTVPDMMICAAAWMVLLQGRVSFTRREVLDVFDQIPGDHEKTLEARIKGFGKATRNGQLVAIGDGTFGLSQEELDRFERLL